MINKIIGDFKLNETLPETAKKQLTQSILKNRIKTNKDDLKNLKSNF
jgi:hypothetical protein